MIGLKREGLDKFYTKGEIAQKCCEAIKEQNIIKKNDLIIEPSAGAGAFIKDIKLLSGNCRFYDIQPDNKEIIQQDFLDLDLSKMIKNIHIIGNPPFGRQSSLAKKFIKKCTPFAISISFILPKSFKKESLQKTFPLNFHLIYEIDLPNNSFLIDNSTGREEQEEREEKRREYNVPCVFQIWLKKSFNRDVIEKEDPIDFKFVKKDENPHISFRRVGVNAGNIEKETSNKSEQSHYFIIFLNEKLLDYLQKFKDIEFDLDNTVGPKSISKPEVIREFNYIIRNID